jgi:hypothetical protein
MRPIRAVIRTGPDNLADIFYGPLEQRRQQEMEESRSEIRSLRRMVQFLPAARDAHDDAGRCGRSADVPGKVERPFLGSAKSAMA